MAKITNVLTTIIVILVFIQLAPNLVKNIKNTYEDLMDTKVKVGKLKIKDAITESGTYTKNLKNFFEKKDIKAILINIESPGGAAGSSKAIYDEILALKKDYPKPVVVLTNDICASGGYYIACASDYIIASSTSIIGSIGSYIGTFKVKQLLENWKINYNIQQSGKYKTALNPFTDATEEMNLFIKSVSDDVYEQFKKDVAEKRKLSLKDSMQWAEGKFFSGKQALALGLIDETGCEYNAIQKIKELAKIEKDKKIEWVKPEKVSTISQLLGTEDSNGDSNSWLDTLADKICQKLGINSESKAMM